MLSRRQIAPLILLGALALPLTMSATSALQPGTPTPTPALQPDTPPPTLTGLPQTVFPVTPDPSLTLTPTYIIQGTYMPPAQTPVYDIPPRAPMIAVDNDALVNVLLLGSDSPDTFYRRTDVMVLVSINTEARTVAMWRIPRHLFVYIPNHTLDLINTAYARGADDPLGAFGTLQETFRYNFGIELDHYARVNYPGFMTIIEALGGLQISVDCAIQDWRLIDPALDPALEANWEEYTLGVGQHTLTPYMALWYARSRMTTGELDRGRRQMDILRAMWQQMRAMGLLAQVSDLWPQLMLVVDTDLDLGDLLTLIPLATDLELSEIARYSGTFGVHYQRAFTPDNGREVLLPNREVLLPMLENFLTPPTANRLGREAVTIDVADASWYGMGLEQVAADRLAWEGYAARALPGLAEIQRELTVIYDYTGQTKGSAIPDLQRLLRVADAQVIRIPDPNRTVDYRVEIGTEYRLCQYGNAEDELVITPSPDTDLSDLPGTVCWLRFRAAVNVREGPDTTYDILDVATPDDHFPITGRTMDGHWWRVDDDAETGWVSAQITNTLLAGECTSVPVVASP